MRAGAVFTCLALLGATGRAFAADEPAKPTNEPAQKESDREPVPPSAGEQALAGAAAVVPGVLVHGTGHYVSGETSTGTKLLVAEGVGFGLVLGGGSTLVATGASRYFAGPSAIAIIFGMGLFGGSFFADLYGTQSRDADAAGRRARPPPWMETELGYRYVTDPVFAYQDFLFERVSMQTGHVRLTPSAWFSMAGDNARYRVEGAYRFVGATPSLSELPVMNDTLDLELGLVHHRYVPERFTRSSMELGAESRYDLGHVGRTLRGAFVEASVGYGIGRIDYDVAGVEVPHDVDDVLLARFAFGVVFRGAAKPGSEALVYYDHRHDDFAGGLVLTGIPSGIAGHFGAEARWFVTRSWGFSANAEVGSAYVAGASFLFRQSGAGPGRDDARQE